MLCLRVQYALRHRKGGVGPISQKPVVLPFGIIALVFAFLATAHMLLLFLNICPNMPFILSTSIDLPLQIVGVALICVSRSFLFLILIALIPIAYFEAKREEKMPIEAFGEEYESYRASTGMFFPKVFKGRN